MALLQSQKGDLKKAEEWFDYARKLEPKNARVRLAHARWLLDQGRAADARTEIDEALKLDPTLKEAQKVQALVAWHSRDLAAAEAILEPLHRDAPADFVVANLLALALIEQDDATKQSRGLQLADVNAVQFPRSAEVIATLGWALYRAGRLDQAEQKLRAAVTGGRTTPDIAYFLARVLVDKGQTDNARKLLQSATELQGAFAHRDDANALLKKLTKSRLIRCLPARRFPSRRARFRCSISGASGRVKDARMGSSSVWKSRKSMRRPSWRVLAPTMISVEFVSPESTTVLSP